jgi:hypothetical protein
VDIYNGGRMSNHAPERRWFRFSVRTLFVILTVSALVAGFWKRADQLQHRAHIHRLRAFGYALENTGPALRPTEDEIIHQDRLRARRAASADFHWAMANKYQRAVCQPWACLWPDPVEPPDPFVSPETP